MSDNSSLHSTLSRVLFVMFLIFWLLIRGGQKSQKLESELADTFFPLHLMSGVTKQIFSSLPLIFPPPLAPYIIQRKIRKIQRKIS